MSFDLKISLDDGGAVGTLDKVTAGMQGAEAAATKTSTAMSGVGTAAEQAGEKTSASTGRMAEALERVAQGAQKWGKTVEEYMASSAAMDQKVLSQLDAAKASLGKLFPEAEMQSQIISLDRLLVQGRIGVEQYDAQLVKLQVALGKSTGNTAVSDELERQQKILTRINAPMREYEAQVKALDALMQQGKLSATDYNREIERAEAAARKGVGPVAGPQRPAGATAGSQATDTSGLGLADALGAVAPRLGATGQLLSGIASGGALAAGAVAGLVVEVVHLGDQYTQLENRVARFTLAGDSANKILSEQYELSKDLHTDLGTTVGIYSRVRVGTDELNLSQRRQIELTREIGQTVVAGGQGAEAAEGLMRRLSLAFETGSVSGRELRSIMREFPAVTKALSEETGHAGNELILMANKGEITASTMIHVFDRLGPEMAKRVDAMRETTGQSWQHFKDWMVLQAHNTIEDVTDEIGKAAAQGMSVAQYHAQQVQKENARQQAAEQERTARVGKIAAAASGLGINVGPFDLAAAQSLDRVRIAARATGFELEDAFEKSKDKALLYGAELDKIKDSADAKKIADDAKRIYEAMYGADEILYKNAQHWTELSDKVDVARKAIEKYKAASPGAAPREQIELERGVSQDEIALRLKSYGTAITGIVQAKDKAKGDLADLAKAMHDNIVGGEEARQKYDALMTTLNDGRLPAVIKMWESFTLPMRDWRDDLYATTALFESGRISILKYTDEMQKLSTSGAAYLKEQYEQTRITDAMRQKWQSQTHVGLGGLVLITPDARQQLDDYLAAWQRLEDAQQRFNTTRHADPVAEDKGVQSMLAQMRDNDTGQNIGPGIKAMNDQLERARVIAVQFEEPAIKYQHALEDIDVAANTWGLTQEQTNFLQHKAREEFDATTEAMQRTKGPQGQYDAALHKLNDQLADGAIGAKKYAEGVDAAKVALLQATGAAGTFEGAMKIEWIKMRQDADNFGASVAKLAVDDLGKLNDAIVTAANGGSVAWGQMADAMIQDLERILIKTLEVKAIGAIFGAISGGEGDAFGAALSSDGIVHAATGFDGVVGGQGGTDSKLFAAMVTPGERVTISPGAYPMSSGGATASGGAAARPTVVQNHIHNHYDKSIGIAAIDSPGGNRSVLNVLRANQGAVRSYSGTRR